MWSKRWVSFRPRCCESQFSVSTTAQLQLGNWGRQWRKLRDHFQRSLGLVWTEVSQPTPRQSMQIIKWSHSRHRRQARHDPAPEESQKLILLKSVVIRGRWEWEEGEMEKGWLAGSKLWLDWSKVFQLHSGVAVDSNYLLHIAKQQKGVSVFSLYQIISVPGDVYNPI